MKKRILKNNRALSRCLGVALAVLLFTSAIALCSCESDLDEANAALAEANEYQKEAEAILARFKSFSSDWESIFESGRIGPEQLSAANQLIEQREADFEALQETLKKWEDKWKYIQGLNLRAELQQYVKLKLDSVKCWRDYCDGCLLPLIKSYKGLVELMSSGKSGAELSAKVAEIASYVEASKTKLEECKAAEKQADDFFIEKKLGKMGSSKKE
ncbi:MAG: hypothetical protein PHO53_07200 [Actinomycetota bacterium]|nr:hypothetical protein [Actinomycetota bacterium]